MWIRRPASRARSAAPHAWLQIAELAQSRAVHGSGHGRKGSNQQPGDAALVLPLMAEVHGVLEGVRFERPPLNAANTETIRQGSHPTLAVPSNPLVIAAQADTRLCGQYSQGVVRNSEQGVPLDTLVLEKNLSTSSSPSLLPNIAARMAFPLSAPRISVCLRPFLIRSMSQALFNK